MTDTALIRACVMGFPVTHSLSPRLHGFWLRQYGIHGSYTAMPVTPEQLQPSLKQVMDEGFAGCNLTLPLKEHALALMDECDSSCQEAGAVNTVVIRDGRMVGYNSDGFGFIESLKAQHPAWDGSRAVILGTGGAARGIVAALKKAGAQHFVLINRTRDKAEKLAQDMALKNVTIGDWAERSALLVEATLLVNCTSLGMTGQPPLDLDLFTLPMTAAVCDIVYRPLLTPLLQAAQREGNPIVEGLPMLLHQGRLGFKLWFGQDPSVGPELYQEIKEGMA